MVLYTEHDTDHNSPRRSSVDATDNSHIESDTVFAEAGEKHVIKIVNGIVEGMICRHIKNG